MSAKEAVLREALEAGPVAVVINATRPGVHLPASCLGEPEVRVNLSWRFGQDFPLELGPSGIKATLSFKGEPFACSIPWRAVAAIGTVLWLEDMEVRPPLRLVRNGGAA